MKQDLPPCNWYQPTHYPPSPWKVVPHHRGLRPLLFTNRSVGSFTSNKNQNSGGAIHVRRGLKFIVLIREGLDKSHCMDGRRRQKSGRCRERVMHYCLAFMTCEFFSLRSSTITTFLCQASCVLRFFSTTNFLFRDDRCSLWEQSAGAFFH